MAIEYFHVTGSTGPVQVNRGTIGATAAGRNVVVPGMPGRRIRVLAMWFMPSVTTVLQIRSGATTVLLPNITLTINANNAPRQIVMPFNPIGWFEANTGDFLNFQLTAASLISGFIDYIYVFP